MSDALGALGAVAPFIAGGSSWRALLRRASFRGVPFFVEEFSGQGGRRLAEHEYPARDTPWAEDMGRKQKQWHFTAYTIGPTYTVQRDQLIAACDKQGTGQLVHPTIGTVNAVCDTCNFTERRDTGGYCAFDLTFFEAGQREQPSSTDDTVTGIEADSDALTLASIGAFVATFDLVGLGSSAVAGAEDDCYALCDSFEALRRPVYGQDQAPLTDAIGTLRENAPTLIYAPTDLTAAIDAVYSAYTQVSDSDVAFNGMLLLSQSFVGHSAPSQDGANGLAFQSLAREFALREMGFNEPGMTLDSTNRAEQVRDQVVQAFTLQEDTVANSGTNDDVYTSLVELRTSILSDIDKRAAQLPSLVDYTTPRSLNSLVLAWRLYQDAERDEEIVARVDAINPAFMPLTGRVLSQ